MAANKNTNPAPVYPSSGAAADGAPAVSGSASCVSSLNCGGGVKAPAGLSRQERAQLEFRLGKLVTLIVSGRGTDAIRAERNAIQAVLQRDDAARAAKRKEAA